MTDQHPLTDEMCEGLMERTSKYPYTDDVIVDMRAAADWQLERVLMWLDEQGYYFVETDGEGNFLDDPEPNIELLYRLMKAMRPQEDNS